MNHSSKPALLLHGVIGFKFATGGGSATRRNSRVLLRCLGAFADEHPHEIKDTFRMLNRRDLDLILDDVLNDHSGDIAASRV